MSLGLLPALVAAQDGDAALRERLEAQEERLRRLEAELERLRGGAAGAGGPGEPPAPASPRDEPRAPAGGASGEGAPPAPGEAGGAASGEGAGAPGAAGGPAPEAAAEPGAAPGPAPARFEVALGEGVTFVSGDDRLSLQLRGRIQVRYTHADADGEDPSDGFMIRRARLSLGGHALTRDLTYKVQLAFSNLDTEGDQRLVLRDASLDWRLARDASVWFGQGKVGFGRQRVVSSGALQLVDRSVVTAELNLDRDVGVQLHSKDLLGLGGRLRYALGVFGGDGRNRIATSDGLLTAARLELLPFGGFDTLDEPDFEREGGPRLAIGAAAAYNAKTNRARSTHGDVLRAGRVDYRHAAVDVAFKWAGFSFSSEVTWRWANRDVLFLAGATPLVERTRSAWGYFAQAGLFVHEQVEVVGRWGELRPLGGSAVARLHEAGGGVGYYALEHALKVQADYFYLWGVHASEGAHEARLQAQLHF